MHAQCDEVVCVSDSLRGGCRAKAAATETRVSQIEAREHEAVPAPTTRRSRAQARLAARRSELSVLKLQQAASAAAAQQLIESQAAAQKATGEAPSVDAAAQQQLVSSSSSAEAAAAATQEGANKAQQELAAQVAEAAAQALIKAAEVVEAAQQQLDAASGKEHAQIAESSLQQMKADAAAATQQEAAQTAEAAQQQMAASAAAAKTTKAAQQQMAPKEAAVTAQAAQQQIAANAGAAAAAAAAKKEAAKTVAAAQQQLQANAVAAADMQTAEVAAAVQQKLQAEAAVAEPAACAQPQPVDMAAEPAKKETPECTAIMGKAAATAGAQTQLDAAATWKVEQLHSTERLSTSEQSGIHAQQTEQVRANSFEQEVKEAALVSDQHTYKKRPDLLTSLVDTAAKAAAVDVAQDSCAPVRFQLTCTDAADHISAVYTQHNVNCTAHCPVHTDMAELAAASAGQLATVQQAAPLNHSASVDELLSVDSSDQLLQQNCDTTSICPAKADVSMCHSTEQPGIPEQQTQQVHAGSLEQEVKEAALNADQQRFRKEADLLLETAAEETAVKVAHEGSTPAPCNCTCTDAVELISAFYSDHDTDHTAHCPGHTTLAELAVDSRGQLAIVQQAFPLHQSASADKSSSVGSSDQLRQQSSDDTSCTIKADLSHSHSTADEQALTLISANSGAEEQMTASLQAPHMPQTSMSSTPATTSPSKVTNLT